MSLPGALYSLLLAVGVWAVDYFTTGAGSGLPWAAIAVATIPVLLKAIAVWLGQEPPAGASRSMDGTPARSRTTKWLLG